MNSSISSSEPAPPPPSPPRGPERPEVPAPGARGALLRFAAICAAALLALTLAAEALLRFAVEPRDEFAAHARLLTGTAAHQSAPGAQADAPPGAPSHAPPGAPSHAPSGAIRSAAFGDSHAARGFVPPEGMINLAFPSEGIEHMDWKARRFFADRAPDRVLLQADPHLFAPYRLVSRLGDHPDRIAAAAAADPMRLRIADPRHRARLIGYARSWLAGGFALSSRIEVLANGAVLSPGDFSALPERRRALELARRIRVHSLGAGPYIDRRRAELQARWSALMDALTERGARICLATFPLSPAYRAAMAAQEGKEGQAARREVMAFFAAEAARTGARHVDLRGLTDDPADFRDADHLNGAAALRLGPAIARACFGPEG